ncbi:hypothetical protein HK105_202876 [Polyrhizophydium stewartii]|uniref:Cyclic nucleotide-binding domain-containing protein n=1 Tax=Polyrhizophydium stewartii TaxID=2732419 RepID=A0ABR4NDK0_9FUNG|nr:hypothetical protein HK105_003128 [Polyrhizophydium stewartii]
MFRLGDFRQASIATTAPCEFLRIHKLEFLRITKARDEQMMQQRKGVLMDVPHFGSGGPEILDQLLSFCDFLHFNSQQIIVHQDIHATQLFTIMSGSCRCVRSVPFVRRKGLLAPYDESSVLRDGDEVVHQTLTVMELGVGDYFPGLPPPTITPFRRENYALQLMAEDAVNTKSRTPISVIASSPVEVVAINRHHFGLHAPESVVLRVIEDSQIFKVPLGELQEAYLERLKWDMFKKKVTQELQVRK